MKSNWFYYLVRDLFPDTDSVVYRRDSRGNPDQVIEWGVEDGRQLGALGLCPKCNRGEVHILRKCDVCDGVGRIFHPYFQSPPIEPEEPPSPRPDTIKGKAGVDATPGTDVAI